MISQEAFFEDIKTQTFQGEWDEVWLPTRFARQDGITSGKPEANVFLAFDYPVSIPPAMYWLHEFNMLYH